ncbi:hypothetical protein FEM48_Zijuj10G0014900 [Ziziphus jujuba var. spinosa]|uniref:AAA+ ATPase At3g28540-like C-terminal domain-containing protein n=1 Tax=Ziziphus jujuba var. spinosa TaxID=714518 RepID=A0A978UKH6_ZIZJJ|nr:hypothetical protein FEM48_Zijuj10G0014900 [Ziziphus jujuba var. spinosa]
MIFTTNYRERLDPALLRPGRMDMHICLSYSNASVFYQLAFNYLGLDHHRLFHEIKRLIEEIEVTPAEVGGELMKSRDPQVSLQALIQDNWHYDEVHLNHPMNFKTLAIDSKLKKELLEDLDNFMNGKEYYKRIGKAWKRGIHSRIKHQMKAKVTLSGLLNFVDGLHSCCRESRIIIFTMNYKGLDQALLRAGRVDTHICLSFCNASIFAQLASTIWGFTVIICLMRSKDDKRDRGESSKSGWRVDEEQYRSSSLFKAL